MPFPFVYVCDLLDKIEGICVREVPLLQRDRVSQTKDSLISWFITHRWRINAQDTNSKSVLMILKPERQTDREYGVEEYLEQILARIFKMPTPMYEKLKQRRDEAHNNGDLGLRLCQIMREMNIVSEAMTNVKTRDGKLDPGGVLLQPKALLGYPCLFYPRLTCFRPHTALLPARYRWKKSISHCFE